MINSNFVYFHTYVPELWDGYVKRGFIRNNAGIRFCQSLLIDEKLKFNNLAEKGSVLWNLIAEKKYPLYIDRLQGGCYIEDYNYNMQLVNEYKAMLGENFFGFQMHEWLSNLRSDYDKLKELPKENWTEENITNEIKRVFPFSQLFLEAANAKEYAEIFLPPKTYEDFLCLGEKLYKMRNDRTLINLLPCNSNIMAANLELKNGTKRVMPEIGAQTPETIVQIAYSRGMSRAYGGSFGAYYEPWGGSPFSACCYNKDGKDEWNVQNNSFPFNTNGDEGGSSRSLQKRLHIYAYLAGAAFISEEWGGYNTFFDTDSFEVTPYGKVKLEFLDFSEKYKPGKFFAPIAVVLPADMPVLENVHDKEEYWFGGMPFADKKLYKKYLNAGKGVRSLLCDSVSHFGNENSSLYNSNTPDAFDIIHEDCENAFDNYAYLVDLTGNKNFSKTHKNAISVDVAKNIINSLMPCEVCGGLHWFVNKLSDGWQLTVMNNDGVDKTVNGEKFIEEAVKTAEISLKDNAKLTFIEGNSKINETEGKYFATLMAGDYIFCKISGE